MPQLIPIYDSNQLIGLYRSLQCDLHRFVSHTLHDKQDVDDVIQETYLKVAELAQDKIATINDPRSYIYQIAHNLALMHLRKQNKLCSIESEVNYVEEASPQSAPDTIFESRQKAALLKAAIEAMPTKRRQIFLFYRLGNLSIEEVARELDMTVDAVEKNIVRALSHIRDWLKESD